MSPICKILVKVNSGICGTGRNNQPRFDQHIGEVIHKKAESVILEHHPRIRDSILLSAEGNGFFAGRNSYKTIDSGSPEQARPWLYNTSFEFVEKSIDWILP